MYCNRPYVFVGPPYYSQRTVFASPLSAFSLVLILRFNFYISTDQSYTTDECFLVLYYSV